MRSSASAVMMICGVPLGLSSTVQLKMDSLSFLDDKHVKSCATTGAPSLVSWSVKLSSFRY